MSTTPDVLVLGSTGLMGREVLRALRRRGAAARVLVRDPARLEGTEGLDVRVGDLHDSAALHAALEGIRAVFHISPHERDEVELSTAVVRACEQAGARIVYAGVAVTAPNPALAWALRRYYGHVLPRYRGKLRIARMVETSSARPVVLAVSNFMQNDEVLLDVIRAGAFVHPCHPKGLNRVDLRDLGDIAATVLLDRDFPSGSYPVVGPGSLNGPECAQTWSEVLGVPVEYADDDATLEAALRAHVHGHRLEDWLASMTLLRKFAVPTSPRELATTERLLGRPATPFAQFARRVAAEHGVLAGAGPASAGRDLPGRTV